MRYVLSFTPKLSQTHKLCKNITFWSAKCFFAVINQNNYLRKKFLKRAESLIETRFFRSGGSPLIPSDQILLVFVFRHLLFSIKFFSFLFQSFGNLQKMNIATRKFFFIYGKYAKNKVHPGDFQ